MELVELSWLYDDSSLKDALKKTLGASGQQIKRHFSSKEQDRPVKARSTSRLPLDFVNHMKINPVYVGPEVKIISETKDYIVLHKPPGVHCHPLCYTDKDTLLNFLVQEGKWEAVEVNRENYDRGLLYRLDHETSGVMVLAKTESFLKQIREHFSTAMKRKFYWAIVEGDFNKEGLWTHHFRASGVKGQKQKVSDEEHELSQPATLAVLKVSMNQGTSLLLVNLKTGLRHQIRAQLAHLGFPILGDELYGGRKAERLFLHALRYEFTDTVEDTTAELFNVFFDLNGSLQMSHDMFGRF
ncbi:RluA family pseudouridine synthase [Peredibacter starrii]|uniref:RluA family pseudouridine synthase n=1 Tax=Peredibacter starrii TaxID=28202 RepID=A0AAX4HMJ2_9BACT|nr:RluA family pseudouridine synthase [Peredibacter starrii]WPU64421.1 RluA family pseudouridine synthase [Peredibacter starrii]